MHIEEHHNKKTYKCNFCNFATVNKNYENICNAQFEYEAMFYKQ